MLNDFETGDNVDIKLDKRDDLVPGEVVAVFADECSVEFFHPDYCSIMTRLIKKENIYTKD